MQEARTAALAERHLQDNGYEVTAGVGKTGAVGMLRMAMERAKAEGRANELPVDHSPNFAPGINPTLATGVTAFVIAAHAWVKR
jgi:hypothetical protein